MNQNSSNWIVIKFGGTSVKDRLSWDHISSILEQHTESKNKILMVCSAPTKVSTLLHELVEAALKKDFIEIFQPIQNIYKNLAEGLEVDFSIIESDFEALKKLCEGISLLEEVTPRTKAKILSFGELMLTQLGYAFLSKKRKLAWQDARLLLNSIDCRENLDKAFLTAACETQYDQTVLNKINAHKTDIIITQGFIAHNAKEETVLLGRGGSDTSAAYLASKIAAKACEIWTDVAGIYTANPHLIPEARLLKNLSYQEAEEIASLGAKVLHPLCIPPLRESQIPLYIKQTTKPDLSGTVVSSNYEKQRLPIKSIISQNEVFLINIESENMWGQVGFLSDVFELFKKNHLSVNLISTSETNVTVSLDSMPSLMDHIEAVLSDLNQFTKASLIGPCAAISLVGREIRSVLPQISHLFEVFASHKIYLLSQAANDLNLTFVIEQDQAERLTKKLHHLLIEQNPYAFEMGKSWQEEHGLLPEGTKAWWEKKQDALLKLADQKNPLYIYDKETLEASYHQLKACDQVSRIFFAVKANPNPEILKLFYNLSLNFECVSIQEIELLMQLLPSIKPEQILFTPNFAPKSEYETAIKLGVQLTIDSLFPFENWPEIFSNQSVLIRIDPGQGSGHHKYVCTGGEDSKFGIPQSELKALSELVKTHNIKVKGLHSHSGSGILTTNLWQETAKTLLQYLELFPDVIVLNLGGGFGVVEKPGQQPFNFEAFNESLKPIKKAHPNLELWVEPGRYLVASAGILIGKVTQVKEKGSTHFVGINTGMNSLIRPALYGSYHEIVNLTRLEAPKDLFANIVGPICESGDTLGYSRLFPKTHEGDIVLIATAGAYGHCMGSNYNLRAPAEEYFLE